MGRVFGHGSGDETVFDIRLKIVRPPVSTGISIGVDYRRSMNEKTLRFNNSDMLGPLACSYAASCNVNTLIGTCLDIPAGCCRKLIIELNNCGLSQL